MSTKQKILVGSFAGVILSGAVMMMWLPTRSPMSKSRKHAITSGEVDTVPKLAPGSVRR